MINNPSAFSATFFAAIALSVFTAVGAPAYAQTASPVSPATSPVDNSQKPLLVLRQYGFSRYDENFSATFSHDINGNNPDDIKNAITIEPALPFIVKIQTQNSLGIYAKFSPGEFYKVTFGTSLQGKNAEAPKEPIICGFITPDLSPETKFITSGNFFPLNAEIFELPIATANAGKTIEVSTVRAEDDRIFEFLRNPNDTINTRLIFKKAVPAKTRLNEKKQLTIPLEQIGIKREPGFYFVTVRGATYSWQNNDSRLVVITDLALQATQVGNQLAVALRTINGNAAVANATISIYSRKNRKIASAETDERGFAKIEIPQKLSDPSDGPAFIFAENGNDKTYLPLDSLMLMSNSYALIGDTSKGDRAYVYAERGICRPGEKITIFADLREGENLETHGSVPAEFLVSAPNGDIFARVPVVGDKFGHYKTTLEIPPHAATGNYSAQLQIPGSDKSQNSYGNTNFSVGEYIPDQIKLAVKAVDENLQIKVGGNVSYYFGAPLANGAISLASDANPVKFSPKNFDGFIFGFESKEFSLPIQRAKTAADAQGNFSVQLNRPEFPATPTCPISVYVEASAQSSAGGRSVTAASSVVIHYADFYVGTKKVAQDTLSTQCEFEFAALKPDGTRHDISKENLQVELVRNEWTYLTREDANGDYSYEWQEVQIPVSKNKLQLADGKITVSPDQQGNYTLRILDAEGHVLNEHGFWYDQGETGIRSKNPSVLAFSLDQEKYAPGATATVEFEAAFDGKAVLVTGNNNAIHTQTTFQIKAGSNKIPVTIPAGTPFGSHYFSLTAVGQIPNNANVQRAFGVGKLAVDQSARKLDVKISAPEKLRPGEKSNVRISLANTDGSPAGGSVQIWAIDRGILSLTNFKAPDAFKFFFADYNCPYKYADSYSLFYPLIAINEKLIGGDSKSNLRRYLPEKSEEAEKSAVVVLDTISVPASGSIETEIEFPNFTGEMSLMAVAHNKKKTGNADCGIILRDPISLKVTAPRFAAPGDEFEVILEAFNNELADGSAEWKIDDSPAHAGTLTLGKGKGAAAKIQLKADSAQNIKIPATLSMGGIKVHAEANIVIREPIPPHDVVAEKIVKPGETQVFENADPRGSIEIGTPFISIVSALKWLERYPYGCLEQTVSTAFPSLAVKPLVEAKIIPEYFAATTGQKVAVAKRHIAAMRQTSWNNNGLYSMWPGESRNAWLEGSLFTYHFLLEADACGFPLEASLRETIVTRLRKEIDHRKNSDSNRAYAIYLLSLASPEHAAAPAKLLLTENNVSDFSKFLAASALIKSGYAAEGMAELKPLLTKRFWLSSGKNSCLDTVVRRAGLTLWLLSEIAPDAPENKLIARDLQREFTGVGAWASTHENAWAVLGLSRYAAKTFTGTPEADVKVGNAPETQLEGVMTVPGGVPVTVKNTGDSNVSVFIKTREVPKSIKPQMNGIKIERKIFDESGNEVTSCKSGDLLRVHLNVASFAQIESVVISDMLPAGLEIEDETLATRSKINESKHDGGNDFYEMMRERRFDRFLAFGRFYFSNGQGTIIYKVRATVRGKFTHPPAQAESMYDPEIRAVGTTGTFEVK